MLCPASPCRSCAHSFPRCPARACGSCTGSGGCGENCLGMPRKMRADASLPEDSARHAVACTRCQSPRTRALCDRHPYLILQPRRMAACRGRLCWPRRSQRPRPQRPVSACHPCRSRSLSTCRTRALSSASAPVEQAARRATQHDRCLSLIVSTMKAEQCSNARRDVQRGATGGHIAPVFWITRPLLPR